MSETLPPFKSVIRLDALDLDRLRRYREARVKRFAKSKLQKEFPNFKTMYDQATTQEWVAWAIDDALQHATRT